MNKLRTLAAAALLCVAPALAEQFYDAGDYHVHYSAMSSKDLSREVATAYGITRSGSRALLNVAVMKVDGAERVPVEAEVIASATGGTGRYRDIRMRLVRERGARYYLGVTGVEDEETLRFDLSVRPEGADRAYRISFTQQFFRQ